MMKVLKILIVFILSLFFGAFVFAQNSPSSLNVPSGSIPNGTGADIFSSGGQGFSGTIYDQSSSNSNPVFNGADGIVSPGSLISVEAGSTQNVSGGASSVNLSINNISCSAINWSSVSNIVAFALCITNKFLIPILATFALLLFIWGVTQYVVNADNEEARENGKKVMIWGIVAISAMVLVYGLVQLLVVTLGLGSGFGIPQLK